MKLLPSKKCNVLAWAVGYEEGKFDQFQADRKDEADTLEAVIMSPFLNADQKVYEIEAHIKELRHQAEEK